MRCSFELCEIVSILHNEYLNISIDSINCVSLSISFMSVSHIFIYEIYRLTMVRVDALQSNIT